MHRALAALTIKLPQNLICTLPEKIETVRLCRVRGLSVAHLFGAQKRKVCYEPKERLVIASGIGRACCVSFAGMGLFFSYVEQLEVSFRSQCLSNTER